MFPLHFFRLVSWKPPRKIYFFHLYASEFAINIRTFIKEKSPWKLEKGHETKYIFFVVETFALMPEMCQNSRIVSIVMAYILSIISTLQTDVRIPTVIYT